MYTTTPVVEERTAATTSEPDPPSRAAGFESDEELVRTHGTLTVVQLDGSETPCARGSMLVSPMWIPRISTRSKPLVAEVREVPVVDGRWEFEIPMGWSANLSSVRCGEELGRLLPGERESVIVAAGTANHLRVSPAATITLRVTDAWTGAELSGVLLVEPVRRWILWSSEYDVVDPRQSGRWQVLPGRLPPAELSWAFHVGWGPDSDALTVDDLSPIVLPRERLEETGLLWVGASGYAWKLIELHDGVSEYAVPLARGGALEVSLEGLPEDRRERQALRLRVRGPVETEETRLRSDTLRFVGLPPGTYTVGIVSSGPFDQQELALIEQAATVAVGEVATVRLALVLEGPEERVQPLFGTLSMPGAWQIDEPRIRIRQIAGDARHWPPPPEHTRGGVSVLTLPFCAPPGCSWDLGDRPIGVYLFSVEDAGYSTRVETGTRSNIVTVPDPVEIEVVVLDEDGVLLSDATRVRWCAAVPGSESCRWVSSRSSDGVHHLTVPSGEVRLRLAGAEYAPAGVTLSAGSGPERVELVARPREARDL